MCYINIYYTCILRLTSFYSPPVRSNPGSATVLDTESTWPSAVTLTLNRVCVCGGGGAKIPDCAVTLLRNI